MYRRLLLVCVASVLALVLFSCGKLTEKTTTETTASTTTPSASVATPATPVSTGTATAVSTTTPPAASQPVSGPAPIASAEYSANPAIRCDLLEVKRVSGNALLVRWRVTNTAAALPKINYDFDWKDLYYVDPNENKKYEYLTDSAGNRIVDVAWGYMGPGESHTSWAKFPAPPPTTTKISLTLPKFPPFEDVPVAQ